MKILKTSTAIGVALALTSLATGASAEGLRIVDLDATVVSFAPGGRGGGGKPDKDNGGDPPPFPYYSWMHPDVVPAWEGGFTGKNQTITVIDQTTGTPLSYNLDGGTAESDPHGTIVANFASMIAPEATVTIHEYDPATTPSLTTGLDVINLSFGLRTASGQYEADWLENGTGQIYHLLEQEIIRLAEIDTTISTEDAAVIVKAAGNGDALGVGGEIGTQFGLGGWVDVLAYDLIGDPNVIFAGALTDNGSVKRNGSGSANLARYSNFPGGNLLTQGQYLVVGVNESEVGIAGTSFAAPIISGYAAMVGQKFTTTDGAPTAGLVANRLLDTARTDTIRNYDQFYHGQGEASLRRALAPDSIAGN